MLARAPFVGLVLTLMAGILLGDGLFAYQPAHYLFDIDKQTAAILMIAAVCLLFYQRRMPLALGISLSALLIVAGFFSLSLHLNALHADIRTLSDQKYEAYEASVQSIPEKRAKSIRVEVLINRVCREGSWEDVRVRAFLSIALDAADIPSAGDEVIVMGNAERPRAPMNPEEFNYRRYLWNKGVVWTDYLPEISYRVIRRPAAAGDIYTWSHAVSEWSDRQFRSHLKSGKSYGLVKAMLLGRRDDLRSEQVDDYTASGTVHILSVSGMHVAIIFLVIRYLLGRIKRVKGGKYLYLFTVIALLGFYALVTGLSPSVLRATLMCVVFVIAEVFSRKRHAMNTLALSAFVLLLFDPQALFDIGFQLSYLAMTGIFLLYKPVSDLWSPSGWLLQYVWQITALSFAAQLATFPLSLYYFHQFPFYFWLVNPFVITLTNGLLPAALLLLLVCLTPFIWLQAGAGWLTGALSSLTNIFAAVPKNLPGYLIENLYLDQAETWILYLIIFLVWYAYEAQDYRWLRYSAGLCMVFVFYSTASGLQHYLTPKGMIHAVPKHAVISFKEGNTLYIKADSAFEADTAAYEFYLQNYAISEGVLKTVFLNDSLSNRPEAIFLSSTKTGIVLSWRGHTIYKGAYVPLPAKIGYCQITRSEYPGRFIMKTHPETIFLLGGQLKTSGVERWSGRIAQSGNKYHDLMKDGALLLP